MKTVLIMGVGAQGSTIAKRLDEEAVVSEIRCADYDDKAIAEAAGPLKKAAGFKVDANNVEEIVKAAEGADLIVNGLDPNYNMNVMDAALAVGANYQDMASGPVSDIGFVEAIERCLKRDPEFEAKGLTALINTGSAPGIANVIARDSVELLDSCDSIEILVYDGIWTKKFIPFWWSPKTAFGDMAAEPIRFENGKFRRTKPFDYPGMEDFQGLGKRRMTDHQHEEPVTMGLLADKVFKGVRDVTFRYGGPALELAEGLYKMGLLSEKPIKVKGVEVVPMDVVSELTPPAPKYAEEIQEVLNIGLEQEEGVFLVRLKGNIDSKIVEIENYVNAPGLTESFALAGLTHESYYTGQGAYIFTKMLLNDIVMRKGLFPPEVLEQEERNYYLKEAEKLKITVDRTVKTRL